MYQKKTLRKMTPLAKKLAIQANEAERHANRLRSLVEQVWELEQEASLDSSLLRAGAGQLNPALLDACMHCGSGDKAIDPETLKVGCRSCGEWAA